METSVELDELKSAWQALDRQMQHQSMLNLHLFHERKLDKVRTRMRWLYAGKIVQILFGDALIYFGILAVMRYLAIPHLLACSVLLLAYGLLTVVLGGVTLGTISRIDLAAPVLTIQKRLGTLRRLYVANHACLGLPWWFLWVAIFMLEVKANVGVDLYLAAPGFVWASLAVGVLGLVASVWLYRRWHDPRYPRLGRALAHVATPRSLRDAKATLDEIAQFEKM